MADSQKDIFDKVTIFGKRTSMTKRQFKVLCVCMTVIVIVGVFALVIAGYFSGWFGGEYGLHRYDKRYYNIKSIAAEQLSIHFLQMEKGNGDCIFVKAGDTEVLIDAGSQPVGAASIRQYIDRFCQDGVLEYVVVTHGDSDHLAGFVGTSGIKGILERYKVGRIIQFARTNSQGGLFADYCAARDKAIADGTAFCTALDCCKEIRGAQRSYTLANGVTMEVLYQEFYETSTSNENDYSVCLLFTQGDNRYLFTGDLERAGEKSLLECNPELKDVTLYKAGHHGSADSGSGILLNKIRPQYVCICCIAGSTEYTQNLNNTFPTQDFLRRIATYTDNVYVTNCAYTEQNEWGRFTDVEYGKLNGDIVFACTDGRISMYFSENNDKLKDSEWFRNNRELPAQWSES